MQIAEGIAAGAICLGFVQSIGLLVLSERRAGNPWRSPRTAVVGAAVAVLWCSYGLQANVALPYLYLGLICLTLLFLIVRRTFVLKLLNGLSLTRLPGLLAVFALFYLIAYC